MPREPPIAFSLCIDHGLCLGVRAVLPHDFDAQLLPEERRFATGLGAATAYTWSVGRVALREALRLLGSDNTTPILADDRGAPVLPPGFVGSVSHKRAGDVVWAVALASIAESGVTLGVDVELLDRPREHIGARVLTEAEQEAIAALPLEARWHAILIRFSTKEAVYKAVNPFLRRYVGFQEVEVWPDANGHAAVRWAAEAGDHCVDVDTRWLVQDGLLITTARASNSATHT